MVWGLTERLKRRHSSIASSLLLSLLIITRKKVPTPLGSLIQALHVSFLSKGGWNVVPGTLIHCTRGSGGSSVDQCKKRVTGEQETPRCSFHEGGCAAQVLSNGALPKILPQSTPNHDPGGTNSEGKVPQETNTSLGTVCRKWAWESVKDRSASSPTHSLFHFILCSLRLGFVSTDKGCAKLPISKMI